MNELDIQPGDVLIALGTAVRAIRKDGDTVTVGGYLIPFTDENNKDLYNTFWDDESDLGALRGNGMDVFVHHTYPLGNDPALVELSERKLTPMTTRVDPGIGLWAETVLNLNDEYEAMIAQMVDEQRLFWSSGSAGHLVRIEKNGYVRRWPVIEGSLTPTPGTPQHRTQITTLRALQTALTEEPATVSTAAGVPSVPTRATLLGNWLENSLSLGALQRIYDALWSRVWDVLHDSTIEPDGKSAALKPYFDEFSLIALRVIDAMLTSAATPETVTATADAVRSFIDTMLDPETRAAQVLSTKHYSKLKDARAYIDEVVSAHESNEASKKTADVEEAPRSAPDTVVAVEDVPRVIRFAEWNAK